MGAWAPGDNGGGPRNDLLALAAPARALDLPPRADECPDLLGVRANGDGLGGAGRLADGPLAVIETRVLHGHVLELLRTLPAETVHSVVTSPPYWGLRDYGLPALVWGGDQACEHAFGEDLLKKGPAGAQGLTSQMQGRVAYETGENTTRGASLGAFCRCSAWRGSLGLEPTAQPPHRLDDRHPTVSGGPLCHLPRRPCAPVHSRGLPRSWDRARPLRRLGDDSPGGAGPRAALHRDRAQPGVCEARRGAARPEGAPLTLSAFPEPSDPCRCELESGVRARPGLLAAHYVTEHALPAGHAHRRALQETGHTSLPELADARRAYWGAQVGTPREVGLVEASAVEENIPMPIKWKRGQCWVCRSLAGEEHATDCRRRPENCGNCRMAKSGRCKRHQEGGGRIDAERRNDREIPPRPTDLVESVKTKRALVEKLQGELVVLEEAARILGSGG